MSSLNNLSLESNSYLKINFDGGDLSSDAGLLLIKEFASKIGFDSLIHDSFKTNDDALIRIHTDEQNLQQMIYQILGAYFTDDNADELRCDPVFTSILDKSSLASQPTLSRFFNRMDEDTLDQFDQMTKLLRKRIYEMEQPEFMLLDLDSTLLNTYGKQEGQAFNYHYQANGYHPLVCYDGLTGDLLKVELRDGTTYSSNGVADFLAPVLDEFQEMHPDIQLFLRGDSGFATPELYDLCETNGCSYAIRLKDNKNLRRLARDIEKDLFANIQQNMVDYAVAYGEFFYKAKSWKYPRRVICKIEKPYGQIVHMHTFIVTNTEMTPEDGISYYCNRGRMENFIKEGKNGFDFAAVSSSSKIVNANRLQLHAFAYNLFNWFRRLVLPEELQHKKVDTIRLKLIKVAARVIRSARYLIFKLCSSCPYKNEFYATIANIRNLKLQLE